MRETFDDPFLTRDRQDQFSGREVGLTHPDAPGFIRLRDNGDIEIVAGEGLSILMHPRNSSITFVADHINFMTREDGLRWNHSVFNNKATSFNEPALIDKDDATQDAYELFEGVEVYMKDMADQKRVPWITDRSGNKMPLEEYIELQKDPQQDNKDPNEGLRFEDLPPGTFSE